MDLQSVLQRALARGDEGDWTGMAEELRVALEEFPEDPAVLCWLGVAERELGIGGIAYERFKRALALQPGDPHVLATVGNGLARYDDPEAEAALRAAALMAPRLPTARWMYGAYLAREGLFPEALRELEAAMDLSPEDPTVALEMGVAMALSGEMERALDSLGRAVELEPGDGWSRVILGLAELELGRMEEANLDLSEGARCRPEDVEAQLLASLTAQAVGWGDLAYEMLERARLVAESEDLPLLEAVEGFLGDGGEEVAKIFLIEEVLPAVLRERLMARP